MQRWLVRIVDTGKVLDLAASSFEIKPLDIPLLAYVQWSVHKHFYEMLLSNHIANVVSG